MKIEDMIDVGEVVSVNFYNAQTTLCHTGEVLFCPTSAKDGNELWIVRDQTNGDIHYIYEPCTITRHPK